MKNFDLKLAGILLLVAGFAISCPKQNSRVIVSEKTTPLKVLSKAYEPHPSQVRDGINDVDVKSLSGSQQELAIKLLNEISCACDCHKMSVAECLVKAPDCDQARLQGEYIIDQVKDGASEVQVVRGLYELILKQEIGSTSTNLLKIIGPNYSKQEMVNSLAELINIDTDALSKTGNELEDARKVAKAFLGNKQSILKYLEGIPDEMNLLHGITYGLLTEPQRTMFEYYFFQNRPDIQKQVFSYLNQGTPESDMLIGTSEIFLLKPPIKTGIKVDVGESPSRGPENAPITLVEYADFQCPYSRRSQETIQQFLDQYPGKVRHIFKNLPLTSIHPSAEPAARAAIAASKQGKFWEYKKLLFENQMSLGNPDIFEQLAKQIGLNIEQFKADMNSPQIKAHVQREIHEALKLGIKSTPTFIVNGTEIPGARSICSFIEAIGNEEL